MKRDSFIAKLQELCRDFGVSLCATDEHSGSPAIQVIVQGEDVYYYHSIIADRISEDEP